MGGLFLICALQAFSWLAFSLLPELSFIVFSPKTTQKVTLPFAGCVLSVVLLSGAMIIKEKGLKVQSAAVNSHVSFWGRGYPIAFSLSVRWR